MSATNPTVKGNNMYDVSAELSGSVWKILVTEGVAVAANEEIMILESMKMEIPVVAPTAGTVVSLAVTEGDAVDAGTLLARLE